MLFTNQESVPNTDDQQQEHLQHNLTKLIIIFTSIAVVIALVVSVLAITLSNNDTIYSAYLQLMNQYETDYGICTVEQEKLLGFCFAHMVDFNNDQTEELILCYREPEDQEYHYDVYSSGGKKAKKVYSDVGNSASDLLQIQHDSLQLVVCDGKVYILKITVYTDDQGNWERREYIGMSDDGFGVEVTLDRHLEKKMYRIDGEHVSEEEYNEQLRKWEPRKTVEFSEENLEQLRKEIEGTKEDLEIKIMEYNNHETLTSVQTPTAETTLIDQYGLASQEQFVSCLGADIQTYPSDLCGIVSIINADINNDETDELVVLRIPQATNSQEVQMIAEIYQVNGNTPTLCASQTILHNIDYSVASNIYLFYSAPLGKHCIMIDSASFGPYTGVNAWTASVYTVTIDAIEEYGNWESVPMVDIETNFESAFKQAGVPYAKNCTTYGSESNASDYHPLCQIEHALFGDSSAYVTRNHKLQIKGIVPAVPSSKTEGLTATDEDWDVFCDMFEASCAYWSSYLEYNIGVGKTLEFKTLPVEEVVTTFLIGDGMPVGMYCYFDENTDSYWIADSDYFDDSEYLDPLHKYYASCRLDANTADWVLKNVFGATPDRNINNNYFYYYGDKMYRHQEFGGGPGIYCKITNTQDLGNGTYGITVDEYDDTDYKYGSLYFVASLQEDPTYGRYWRYEKVTLQTTYN